MFHSWYGSGVLLASKAIEPPSGEMSKEPAPSSRPKIRFEPGSRSVTFFVATSTTKMRGYSPSVSQWSQKR